jgi:hypothetical protein
MLIIENKAPNFVAIENFIMYTFNGEIIVEEGEPLDLRSRSGIIVYGSEGTVLEFTNKTTINDLLERVEPASFELKLEEDGELSLVASIKEHMSDRSNKILEIKDDIGQVSEVIAVTAIRSFKGELV